MLKVHSIFESISGEAGGFPQGTWMTGIRLQGCNLKCKWCDTPQAQQPKQEELHSMGTFAGRVDVTAGRTVTDLLHSIKKANNKHILITGGEPLLQPQVIELAEELLIRNYEVAVETNGTLTIPCIPGVDWVVDYKCPSSGIAAEEQFPGAAFIYQLRNLTRTGNGVHLKFVVADATDIDFSVSFIKACIEYGLEIPFIISPIDAKGEGITNIVDRIKNTHPDLLNYIVFSIQLHKIFNLP